VILCNALNASLCAAQTAWKMTKVAWMDAQITNLARSTILLKRYSIILDSTAEIRLMGVGWKLWNIEKLRSIWDIANFNSTTALSSALIILESVPSFLDLRLRSTSKKFVQRWWNNVKSVAKKRRDLKITTVLKLWRNKLVSEIVRLLKHRPSWASTMTA